MNEDVNPKNMRIHSRADELIACLEGEIAKRDARIMELDAVGVANEKLTQRIKELKAEIAALKAQGVVMPEPMKRGDEGGSGEYGAAMIRGYNACLREVARLNAAPVQQVSVPDASTDFSQFLSAVMDAAGLVRHGRRSKELSEYLGSKCMEYRCFAAPAAPAADAGLVEALEMALEIGDGCSRGFLGKFQAKARAALAAHRSTGVV